MKKSRIYPVLIIILVSTPLLWLSGCSNLGYYMQSVSGHMELVFSRQSIEELLEKEETPQKLKNKLSTALQIRAFASESLALPNNDSYKSYVDLNRKYVVWNVVAAPEFSLELHEWCFLFAGCIRYRGYYDKSEAQQYAAELKQQGEDVYVRGAAAYSTLGWFDDPLLNTVINREEIALAGLIFHELAHQQLYVKNDSAFNEGFAKTVEIEGMKRWLQQMNNSEASASHLQRVSRSGDFINVVKQTRQQLKVLYASARPADEMRIEKQVIFNSMRENYKDLKQQWGGYNGYDRWFSNEINNAKIGSISTYQDYVPAFQRLLNQSEGDMAEFFRRAASLADEDKKQRQKKIDALLSISEDLISVK